MRNFSEKDVYREKIIELLKTIDNEWILAEILKFIQNIIK